MTLPFSVSMCHKVILSRRERSQFFLSLYWFTYTYIYIENLLGNMKHRGGKNRQVNPIMRFRKSYIVVWWCYLTTGSNTLSLYKLCPLYPQPHFPCISKRCLWKPFSHFDIKKKTKKKQEKKDTNVEFFLIRCE